MEYNVKGDLHIGASCLSVYRYLNRSTIAMGLNSQFYIYFLCKLILSIVQRFFQGFCQIYFNSCYRWEDDLQSLTTQEILSTQAI